MEDYSVKTGFQIDVLEKAFRLTEILREFTDIKLFKDSIVLKGGTAINYLYFKIPRLSIDIDLDYIGSVNRETMIKDRKIIDKTLTRFFTKLGYTIYLRKTYALLQYTLGYKNTAGNNDRIKVEVNFFNRTSLFGVIEKDFHNPFGIKQFKAKTLTLEDLFGRKLRALLTRTAPRDLYDIYRLLKDKLSFNREKLRKCFIFYLCCSGDPRKISIEVVDEVSDQDIKTNLLPFLQKGEKITVEEMKKVVTPMVSDFLSFSASELNFISKLFNQKSYEPDILFQNISYNKDVKHHPGIFWRIKNL